MLANFRLLSCFYALCLSLIFSLETLASNTKQEPRAKESIEISTNLNDLDTIKKRGILRILVPANLDGNQYLPRFASPVDQQQQIAQEFAESMGLMAEIVPVLTFKELFPALLGGKGDLIAANLTITEKRKEWVDFSVPIEHVKEVVLVHSSNKSIKKSKDLIGKTLFINPSTSFLDTAEQLQRKYTGIKLVKQKKYLQDEDNLDLVADEVYDATIRDSNIAAMYLSYRDDIKKAFTLPNDKAIAWALRPNSPKLKEAVNQYLGNIKLSAIHNEKFFGDLAKIKKRGFLRVLLKNNSSSYFFWKGELMGFEYEMAKAYAKQIGVKLAVVVPKEGESMLDWLELGKADLAAGFLTPTPDWTDRFIAPSVAYHKAAHHLVTQKNNTSIKEFDDLNGKTIFVHQSSIYWKVLSTLKALGLNLTLKAAPENLEIEEIIEKVANGEYEATLVAEHLLDIELAAGVPVKSALVLEQQYKHTLAVREENTDLLSSLNDYITSHKEGKLYKRLYRKYFSNTKTISRMQKSRLKEVEGQKVLSRYDDYVKKYSEKYGFDWRLITAQMFSESRFRPDIKSSAGAIGLMQVMANTGKQLKLRPLNDPETNVHAGVKYMHWLSQKFEQELPVADRMWFTLASYNAGLGHVLDARRLAARTGLNKNRWFGHVEKAMLMLSKKQYYKKSRYGYVRGREPVGYVKKIKDLYENYINVVRIES